MAWKDAVNQESPEVVELYAFKFEDGSWFRATSYSRNITWNGELYHAVPISRDSQEQEATVKVGTTRVTLYLGDYTRTLIDVDRIRNQRALDRGEFYLYQVGLDDPVNNWRLRFNGWTGIVEVDRLHLTVEFRDIFFLLKKNVPADIYAESCNLIYGSDECQFDPDSVKVSGAAGVGSDAETIVDAGRTEADGYFDRGYIVITTGTLTGSRATIKAYIVGQILLFPPLFSDLSPGDQYEAWPHCQKVFSECNALGNKLNFFGFQYIPSVEDL